MPSPIVSATFLARLLATALAIRVLPHPGGPVQQDPLRRRELVLGEQVLVQERQLDGVGDLFDLVVETADVGVRDVGHLFEQQVLDLGPGQLLEQEVRPGVEAQVVALADVGAADRIGEFADALLVGAADHDDADAVVHDLFDRHHLTGDLRRRAPSRRCSSR